MGNIAVKNCIKRKFAAINERGARRFFVQPSRCRYSKICYLHVLKQNLAKCVVLLTSELKLNVETLRIL